MKKEQLDSVIQTCLRERRASFPQLLSDHLERAAEAIRESADPIPQQLRDRFDEFLCTFIFGWALRRARLKELPDAQDVASTVMSVLFKRLKSRFPTWVRALKNGECSKYLQTCTQRAVIDCHRQRKLETTSLDETVIEQIASPSSTFLGLGSTELGILADEVVADLSQREQVLIDPDLSGEQKAKDLGVAQSAVSIGKHRTYDELRALILTGKK